MSSGVSDQFPVDQKQKWCKCRIYSRKWNIKYIEGMFLPCILLPHWSCICIIHKCGASNQPQPPHLHAGHLSLPPFYPYSSKHGSHNNKVIADRERSDLRCNM